MSLAKQPSADVQRNGFIKDSFGFKMSKKVAELTQVVHMLFARNHEREVEIDVLKAAYEEEIKSLIKEAKSKTEKLEFLLRDATRQRQKEAESAADSTAMLLKETQDKMEQMRQELIEERSQAGQYRDLLSECQRELEKARLGSRSVSKSLEQTTQSLSEKEIELNKMKTQQKKLQDQYKIIEKELQEYKLRCSESEEKFTEIQRTVSKLNKSLEESNRRADELSKKLLQTEEDVKAAKRELKKRSSGKNTQLQRSAATTNGGSRRYDKKDDEIESMRREIDRLRMELSNREGNFNRVFAKFQPVVVSPDAQKNQTHRMMMVTPSFSEANSINRWQNSSRPITESSFFPPRTPGNSRYGNFNAVNGTSSKSNRSLSQTIDPSRVNSASKNSQSQFRLVYTK